MTSAIYIDQWIPGSNRCMVNDAGICLAASGSDRHHDLERKVIHKPPLIDPRNPLEKILEPPHSSTYTMCVSIYTYT